MESGGLEAEPEAQELNVGRVEGDSYLDLRLPRLRAFGGSSGHWTGEMAVLEARDLAPRPWIAASGWPIAHEELARHSAEALAICGGEPLPAVSGSPFAELPRRPPATLELRYRQRFVSRALRFGKHYRAELESAANVEVWLHATATELVLDESGQRIAALALAAADGRRFVLRARTFVLAAGGLENPRLLLLSDRRIPGGVGNGNDLVGRYFQEHPIVDFGEAIGFPRWLATLARAAPDRQDILRDLCPTAEVARRERLLAFGAQFVPRPERGFDLDRRVKGNPPPLSAAAARLLPWTTDQVEPPGADGAPARTPMQRGHLHMMVEMEPERTNRVRLGDELDRFGCRRIVLELATGESFRRTVRVGARAVARELARRSYARVALSLPLREDEPIGWRGAAHLMGTTRMAASPSDGVVDPDGRVFGVENLYVAGSSLFPQAGYGNPTVTLVALALRLGDHLKRVLS